MRFSPSLPNHGPNMVKGVIRMNPYRSRVDRSEFKAHGPPPVLLINSNNNIIIIIIILGAGRLWVKTKQQHTSAS